MSTLILIRGLPVSGKTALAKKFKGFIHLENAQHLPAGKVTEQQIIEAEAKTLADTQAALSKGFDVVVSNCFSKVAYMFPFIAAAMAFNAGVQIFEALKQHRATLDFTAEEMEVYRIEFESIMSVLGKPSTPFQIKQRKAEEARLAKIETKRTERDQKKFEILGQQDTICAKPGQPVVYTGTQEEAAAKVVAKLVDAAIAAGGKQVGDEVVFDNTEQFKVFTENAVVTQPEAANGQG